jgi:hypothetical protein
MEQDGRSLDHRREFVEVRIENRLKHFAAALPHWPGVPDFILNLQSDRICEPEPKSDPTRQRVTALILW